LIFVRFNLSHSNMNPKYGTKHIYDMDIGYGTSSGYYMV